MIRAFRRLLDSREKNTRRVLEDLYAQGVQDGLSLAEDYLENGP